VTEKGKSDVTAAQARLAQTKAGLSVARANRSQSPAYQQNIAALAASVAVAEAQLSQVRSKLADTELRSSIAGVVTARQADEGSLASPGQPLLTVQYLKWLYVTASLPIEQSALVRPGVRVVVTVDALPGETFEAPVVEVNPSADDASRQFTIRLKLDNAKGTLKPGMFVHLKIITGKVRGATVVPRDAVKTTDEGSTVTLVDKEMVAHVTPVTLGAAETDALQITQGVQPGDRVVILAYQPVKDAQKVREGDAKKPKGKAKP
jgi:RND family efflux transporter MFP subunit